MTKPIDLNHQMLNYLLSMSREQQDKIPPTRAGVIAWLGTNDGLAWLIASPVGRSIAGAAMHFDRTGEAALARPWME